MPLSGKVVLVTGAGSGVGRASALRFARQGAKVLVSDYNPAGGQETVDLIGAEKARFVVCDMRQPAQIRALVDATLQAYGRLDIVHSNAGDMTLAPSIDDLTEEVWRRDIELNLNSHFVLLKAAVPALRKSDGVIVFTSSIAGLRYYATGAHYAAAKYGLLGLTRSLAPLMEKDKIRLNAICPIAVDTPFLYRASSTRTNLLTPDDVARGVYHLATEPGLTGAVLWTGVIEGELQYGWVKPYAVDPVVLPE